jgi:hypothetical protein
MAQRRINIRDIAKTLDNHHTYYNDRKGNSCLVRDLENGKMLRIVVASNGEPSRVITAIITEQNKE